MCGIAGFFGHGNQESLKQMTDSIAYRGPDADGFYVDADHGVYLGHRRLSILDLAGGAQPMQDTTGEYIITFNGEIYNHRDLRAELTKHGVRFATADSDTETLLEAYKKWGAAMLEMLNGMFAFVIYDKQRSTAFAARDRFGKKPFFYTMQHNTFVFASELHAVSKHPSVTSTISTTSLQKYFAYGYIPAPRSLYENIYKLPGGHYMLIDVANLSIRIEQWWSFAIEPTTNIPSNPEREWGEQIIDLLSKAVQRRLMSDVPFGFFLSGGIDSSALVAMASRHLPGDKINTFSIGFTESSFDESAYAQLVAEKYNTTHHTEVLDLDKALDLLPHILSTLDEPMGDSSLLPTYLLCNVTRKHVTVALGGDGADELFCGYDPFRALKYAEAYKKYVPRPVHQAISMIAARLPVSHRNMSLDFKIKRTLRGLGYDAKFWNAVWMGPLAPPELNELFGTKLSMDDLYSEAIEAWDGCTSSNYTDKATEFYVKLYLQDDILVKVDRASMMNSLEVRAPFLDINLVNLVRTIPAQYRFRNGQSKYILKKALEPYLPHEILYRPKKGFGVPIGKWMSDGKIDLLSSKSPSGVSKQFVQQQINDHRNLSADNRNFLWNWVVMNA